MAKVDLKLHDYRLCNSCKFLEERASFECHSCFLEYKIIFEGTVYDKEDSKEIGIYKRPIECILENGK